MQHVPEPAVDASSGHESESESEDEPGASVASAAPTGPDEIAEPEAEPGPQPEADETVPETASAELDGFARDLDTVDAALEALDNDDLDAAEARVAELTTDSHAAAATPTNPPT